MIHDALKAKLLLETKRQSGDKAAMQKQRKPQRLHANERFSLRAKAKGPNGDARRPTRTAFVNTAAAAATRRSPRRKAAPVAPPQPQNFGWRRPRPATTDSDAKSLQSSPSRRQISIEVRARSPTSMPFCRYYSLPLTLRLCRSRDCLLLDEHPERTCQSVSTTPMTHRDVVAPLGVASTPFSCDHIIYYSSVRSLVLPVTLRCVLVAVHGPCSCSYGHTTSTPPPTLLLLLLLLLLRLLCLVHVCNLLEDFVDASSAVHRGLVGTVLRVLRSQSLHSLSRA